MIVREVPEGFLLVKQHDHGLAAGEIARHWAREPFPLRSVLYAVAQHDVAWQGLDESVSWNEEAGRPHDFVDYPVGPKVRAYTEGVNYLQARDPYAACLCSMHYETLTRGSEEEAEARFAEEEARRQEGLRAGMSGEEAESLEGNLALLKLCDGLSLFACLNEPGCSTRYPQPYKQALRYAGEEYAPEWADDRTLVVRPNPFSGPFGIELPYRVVGRDGGEVGGGRLELRVTP